MIFPKAGAARWFPYRPAKNASQYLETHQVEPLEEVVRRVVREELEKYRS